MKVTKSQLKGIIKEEISKIMSEVGGLSPEEFRQMEPSAALGAARTGDFRSEHDEKLRKHIEWFESGKAHLRGNVHVIRRALDKYTEATPETIAQAEALISGR